MAADKLQMLKDRINLEIDKLIRGGYSEVTKSGSLVKKGWPKEIVEPIVEERFPFPWDALHSVCFKEIRIEDLNRDSVGRASLTVCFILNNSIQLNTTGEAYEALLPFSFERVVPRTDDSTEPILGWFVFAVSNTLHRSYISRVIYGIYKMALNNMIESLGVKK